MGMSDLLGNVFANILTWIIIIALALLSRYLFQWILIRPLEQIISRAFPKWTKSLKKRGVLRRLALLIPGIIVYAFAPVFPDIQGIIQRLSSAFMILVGAIALDAILDTITDSFQEKDIARDRPIKSYATVVKLIMYVVVAILVIANLADTSPWGILSGIGAMTAVLLVIFHDTLLGLVASVQITKNELVAVGDWIEVPKYQADGDVIDITLTTVRIQNWDRTITTVPSYALISSSFKNWKGMFDSGGRRIKRSIFLDMTSIRFVDDELYSRLSKIQLIQPYLLMKKKEIADYNREHEVDETVDINGRRMTNLGTFRAYVTAYLKQHPGIHKGLIMMVRQLQPTETGIPLEIYAFTRDTAWVNYEGIQSDIFDHMLAVLAHFDLRVVQMPTGNDLKSLRDSPLPR